MIFFSFLTLFSIVLEVTFISISIAAGLYYLAELAEEYCHFMKKIIFWTITTSTAALVGLWLFENLPWSTFIPALLADITYYATLKNFPTIKITSVPFLSAICLLPINHFIPLRYFTSSNLHLLQIFAYFVICIWAVPFLLFISLSTDDYSLPLVSERSPLIGSNKGIQSAQPGIDNYFIKTQPAKKYKLLSLYHYIKESLPIFGNKKFY